jgi:ribonuclease E
VEASDPATADGDGGADTRQEPGTEEAPREAGTAEPVAAVGDPTPTTVKVAPKDSGERPGDPAHDDAAAMDAESGPRGEPAPPEAEPQEERAPPQAEPQGERAQPKAEPQPEPVGAEAAEEREDRPRRRGWWSFGR